MDNHDQKGNNPSDQKESQRSDAPEIPESEQAPKEEPQPGTRQNVKQEQQQNQNYLTKEDLPDATTESKGKMGSGQRQDSN
jgi:hypothetical protein